MKINVLVVDESAAIRDIVGAAIDAQRDMRVMATAPNAATARDLLEHMTPDVLALDAGMRGMNGLAFLDWVMHSCPMPVLMLSSSMRRGADFAFRALALGALGVVAKPSRGRRADADHAGSIAEAIRGAYAQRASVGLPGVLRSARVIVIGASMGGARALRYVLRELPEDVPPILVSLCAPGAVTSALAPRLAKSCRVRVKEAEDCEPVLPGSVYFAPAGREMRLANQGGRGFAVSLAADARAGLLPADALFHSAAEVAGADAIGIVMSGTGRDGAGGIIALREQGAFTLAQDEASEGRAVDAIAPLADIARVLLEQLAGMR